MPYLNSYKVLKVCYIDGDYNLSNRTHEITDTVHLAVFVVDCTVFRDYAIINLSRMHSRYRHEKCSRETVKGMSLSAQPVTDISRRITSQASVASQYNNNVGKEQRCVGSK